MTPNNSRTIPDASPSKSSVWKSKNIGHRRFQKMGKAGPNHPENPSCSENLEYEINIHKIMKLAFRNSGQLL